MGTEGLTGKLSEEGDQCGGGVASFRPTTGTKSVAVSLVHGTKKMRHTLVREEIKASNMRRMIKVKSHQSRQE